MDFTKAPFQEHARRLEADAEPPTRAVGENYRIEENVSAERLAHFEAETGYTDDLKEAARDYFDLHIQGEARGARPTTFDPDLNAGALLGDDVEPRQKIVRLERIDELLSKSGWTYAQLQDAHTSRDAATLSAFVALFETFPGERPAFAAFKSEVEADVGRDDWLERLCERFGLYHHFGTEPRQFALMEYTAGEVLAHAGDGGIDRPFALASVLESRENPAFHPVPRATANGFAVDLGTDAPSRPLVREILHVRMPYKAAHVKRIAESRVNGKPDILAARAVHLDRVRAGTRRADFGHAA
ncbi:hypothetical protein [Salinarimonas sp.]|uniref:hypothetical protein n=1 Tax=Salinarimonas sp. TaxID=2766526 RepID=UPI0032D9729A